MPLLSFLFGVTFQQNKSITILNKVTFKVAINSQKVQVVDVRTPNEFNSGHIKNAKNIDFFNQESFSTEFNKLNKEEPIYVYCRSGNRSQRAAKVLEELGFKTIYNFSGGWNAWSKQ